MGSSLAEHVASLRSDRAHGGGWMARQAVEALAEVADVPAGSTEELLGRLDAAGRELVASRPAMGGIAGAVGRVLAAAHQSTHLPPEELRRLVHQEVAGLVAGRDRAAASIAIQLAPALSGARVLTHSASATVREAVVHTPPSSSFAPSRRRSRRLRAPRSRAGRLLRSPRCRTPSTRLGSAA